MVMRRAMVAALVLAVSGTVLRGQVEKPAEAKPAAEVSKPAANTPTVVTVNFPGTPADEAFKELGAQANITFTVDQPSVWEDAEPIELKVDNGNFWVTFREMCKQAGLGSQFMYGDSGRSRNIRLMPIKQMGDQLGSSPAMASMGHYIVLQSANRNYSISYNQAENTPHSSLSLTAMIWFDPKTTILKMGMATLTKAEDENGPLRVNKRQNDGWYGSMQGMTQSVSIDLPNTEKVGKKLVEVEGYIPMTVVARSELVEINDPLNAQPLAKSFPRTEVTIDTLKKNGSGYQIKVTFKPKGRSRDSSAQQIYWGAISLIRCLDASGNAWNYSGGGGGGRDASGGVSYTLNFANHGNQQLGAPAKLSWAAPVETAEVQVPFSFKDLQLP